VAHSALSAAAHEGRLTAGIELVHGRVRVVDAAAAAAQWRSIHVPRIDLAIRKAEDARAAALAMIVVDRDGYDWTVQELLRQYETADALIGALVRDAIEREDRDAYLARIRGRLTDELARRTFDAVVWLAIESDEDEDEIPASDATSTNGQLSVDTNGDS
jgi:hypothetical protein